MKTKSFFLVMLFVLVYFFAGNSVYESSSVRNSGNLIHVSSTGGDRFIIGAFNTGAYSDLSTVSELGFNLFHKYTGYDTNTIPGRTTPYNSPNDNLLADINVYRTEVTNQLRKAADSGMTALMMRPKIEWLCFGQRSDYQCEPISKANDKQWFYSFRDSGVGHSIIDSGAMVKYCDVNPSLTAAQNAGWVVKGLKANTEQSNPGNFKGDHESKWFIKPKIRISPSVGVNTKVCQVIVIGESGHDTLMKTDIIANDFKQSGVYNGEYREEYSLTGGRVLTADTNWGKNSWYHARGEQSDTSSLVGNHADIQVFWYGECDMWIDYVRVDDDIANDLFSGLRDPWLQWEAQDIACASGTDTYRFYIELFEYNNVPCMSYVSKKLDYYAKLWNSSKNISLLTIPIPSFYSLHVPWADRLTVQNETHFKKFYLDKMQAYDFLLASYPFNSSYVTPESYTTLNTWTRIPNTLRRTTGNGVLGAPVSPSAYDTWLQDYFDASPYEYEPGSTSTKPNFENMPGHFRYTVQMGDALSKATGLPFIFNAQGHIWKLRQEGSSPIDGPGPRRYPGEVQREPTNEELDLTANLALTYGARGIIYFQYNTMYDSAYGKEFYERGIANKVNGVNSDVPRDSNVYGQLKWEKMKSLVKRLKKWEPYIMSFDDSNRHSYIYRLEKSTMSSMTFINDLVTTKYDVNSETYEEESASTRYVQASVFKNDSADTRYFMIVNRRCSPIDTINPDGRRKIKIKFNSDDSYGLANFDNWKIIDVEADTLVATFDKNSGSFSELGWFNPGQGKLYKVVPVLKTGGIFVGNEYVKDISFTCSGMVNANNHDLTLKGNMFVSFADIAGISMGSGKFYCGVDSTPSLSPSTGLHLINLNSKWQGIVFGGTNEVKINNTEIKEVNAVSSINNGYSLTIQNPTIVRISKCKFTNSATDTSGAGAINVQYLNTISSPSIDILDNEINVGGNIYDAVTINAYSGMALSPYIRWNRITKTSSDGGGIGIAFLNLTGGTVRNNTIANAKYGMYVYHSTVNLWRNTITSSVTASRNLWGLGITTLNMQPSSGIFLGGENTLSNTTDSRCIHIEDAFFNINGGYNNFKLTNASERHLYGYMPISDTIRINALKNCFSIDNTNITDTSNIRKYVIWGNSTRALFNFYSFSCGDGEPAGCTSTSLDGDIRDTTWNNCDISMNENNSEGLMAGGKSDNPGYEKLYNDINLNIQKREFAEGVDNCKTLLEQFTDSVQTLDIVGKLFYCVAARNPNETELTALKSYYESFILNHAENSELTAEIFYYIQKTKAKLGDYESAMQGFETIMSQFPTTYMGLLARWDYMATHLLDSLSGQGGGMKDHESEYTVEQEQERLFNRIEDPKDKYDKKKFTKEDRKVIVNNVVKSFITKKDEEIKKVKNLEEKVTKNIATPDEKNELKKVNKLKEIIKPQRVNTLIEHVNAIRNDVRQFADLSSEKDDNVGKTSTIPFEYKLNQNYPNPFNPTTKINYELKNAGYVSLKIYDLLGREIAELVNETKDAGRYTVDFNASKYMMASGIYFYRIKAGEFVDTKRMVLIK